ncbi:MAG: hypothetical protein NZ580_06915 [Bacteroidia bacterium]|nr:hypothetical protein [Bacteroidia bacterium]MDW8235427.1 hypothetical protein [Bacteroidia bacterium]
MSAAPLTIVEPPSGIFPSLSEVWKARGFIIALVLRTLKVRYKYTTLGIGWLIVTPLISAGIFTFFFGKLAKIPSGDIPYPLFVLSGILVWNFFTSSLTRAADSLTEFAGVLSKTYIPRLCFPISSLLGSVIDFMLSLGGFVAIAIIYGYYPGRSILFMPLFFFSPFLLPWVLV